MVYLIVGRSGTGKTHLGELMERIDPAVRGVKSYTTRPKRTETEDSHIFVTREEADAIHDKVATTTINGYDYFATKTEVENSDFYVIDPNGIWELLRNMPDETFRLVYVTADPATRKKHALLRASDPAGEEAVYDARIQAENDEFSEFEEFLESGDFEAEMPNVSAIHRIYNEFDESFSDWAKHLIAERNLHNITAKKLIPLAAKYHIVHANEDGAIRVMFTVEPKERYLTDEMFADMVLGDDKGFSAMIKELLMRCPDEVKNAL